MRILIVVDGSPWTGPALKVGSNLAVNLWAHVNLLTVFPKNSENDAGTAQAESVLSESRSLFLETCGPGTPYAKPRIQEEKRRLKPSLMELQPVLSTGSKDLKLRIRFGEPAEEIAAEAYEEGVDLIIMGAGSDSGGEPDPTPLDAAMKAYCSTLIIRDESSVENIIVGVENPDLDQTSREMFHQMATIFHAPSAMYKLPSISGGLEASDEAMDKLVRIFKVHDLGVVSGNPETLSGTIRELFEKSNQNLLVLR